MCNTLLKLMTLLYCLQQCCQHEVRKSSAPLQ